MQRLVIAYPNLAKMVKDIGRSYEGRTISALKVFPRSVQLQCSQRAFIPGVSHRTKSNKFFIELNRTKSESNRTMKFDFVRSSNEIGQQFFCEFDFQTKSNQIAIKCSI